MSNAFSQVIAILVSILLFFGLPLMYANERIHTARQYYVLSESIAFVDSICNTGFLTREMYETYEKSLSNDLEIYEITMTKETKNFVLEEDDSISVYSDFEDEKDIVDVLETDGSYFFRKGDLLKVSVVRTKGRLRNPFEPEEMVMAYYGGRIKYEVD